MSELRLFPLQSVLFPGTRMPLQVFEPRYLQLVRECLEAREPFGIVLIREGPEVGGTAEPYQVGTTARIEEAAPIDQVRIRIVAVGERRFRIARLHHDRPYLWADVDYPVDEVVDVPAALRDDATEAYRTLERLRQTLEGRYEREPSVPEAPGPLADALAAAGMTVLPPQRLQPVLEALDVRRRLEYALGLAGELIEVAHREAAQVVAARWGAVERRN